MHMERPDYIREAEHKSYTSVQYTWLSHRISKDMQFEQQGEPVYVNTASKKKSLQQILLKDHISRPTRIVKTQMECGLPSHGVNKISLEASFLLAEELTYSLCRRVGMCMCPINIRQAPRIEWKSYLRLLLLNTLHRT
jgi:hypothetical protein